MEYWEFLIQKEGDRAWLPLESPDVEILEGRYRIVARSSSVNETVEIRVTHQSTYEIPPKRRMQKRTSRTNAEGLIVVLPFARLKPGTWDVHCSNEATADRPENSWQHAVRLDVLPSETDETDLEADPQSGTIKSAQPEESNPKLIPLMPASPEAGDRTIAPKSASVEPAKLAQIPASKPTNKPEGDRPLNPPTQLKPLASPPPPSPPPAPEPAPPQPPTLKLTLNRSAYMLRGGLPVTLSGRVEIVLSGGASATPVKKAQLHVLLRDPQNSKVVLDVRHSLPELLPPVPFSFALEIPSKSQNRLLVGEISLYDARSEALDTTSFTITPDVEDLLGEVSPQLIAEYINAKPPVEDPNQSFENWQETLQNPQSVKFQPSLDRNLPPLLHKPNPEKAASKPLDLPTFPRQNPYAPSKPSNVQKPAAKSPEPPTVSEPSAELSPNPVEAEAIDTGEAKLPEMPNIAPTPPATPPPSPDAIAFQSLKVQERFLTRLNSLANDDELTQWLKTELPLFEEVTIEDPESMKPEAKKWEMQEFVVDDEPEPPVSKATPFTRRLLAEDTPDPLLLPEDEPVPTPVLVVREETPVTGRPTTVYVRLPDILPRIYVKLWMQDRQARTVLDGPHWLTEFSLNARGDLEATIQLVVPHGTLEIQLEAIAMEMQTQRESHKVSLERRVMPPGPPSLPLE